MGAGITQIAASAGHKVIVCDSNEISFEKSKTRIKKGARTLLSRGKIKADAAATLVKNVSWTRDLRRLSECDLIIEAIIENSDIKKTLFEKLEEVIGDQTILATNTSSLSVSSLASNLQRKSHFLGLHFFNPAPIMKLVEIIPGLQTDSKIVTECFKLMEHWGKIPVIAKDVPGFIVNRTARPFYGEGWKAYEEGICDATTLDFLYRDLAGFKMGPLELGDLIGHDVNSKAAVSVFNSYHSRTRFHPSLMQARCVESGLLGKKSGQGVYDYRDDAPDHEIAFEDASKAEWVIHGPGTESYLDITKGTNVSSSLPRKFWRVDDILVGFSHGESARAMAGRLGEPVAILDWVHDVSATHSLAYSQSDDIAGAAARSLIAAFEKRPIRIEDRPGALVFRTCLQLVNAAADAIRDHVGDENSIDKAMRFGVNYPFGPFEWAQKFGYKNVVKALELIATETGEYDLYAPNHILRAMQ